MGLGFEVRHEDWYPHHTEAAAIPTHRPSLWHERAGNGRGYSGSDVECQMSIGGAGAVLDRYRYLPTLDRRRLPRALPTK
jgi:hypothetical protein